MQFCLNTVILFVNDMDTMRIFYTEVLQLALEGEAAPDWVLLNTGACQIGLHKAGKAYQNRQSSPAYYAAKLVFDIKEDIYAVREDLVRKNVRMKAVMCFDGYDFLVCDGLDPEDNVFQLKQRKQAAPAIINKAI